METEGPYTYPLTDRADILQFLGEHLLYSNDIGGCALAWNIKVHYAFDTSGHKCTADFGFEERFDAVWESYVGDDPDMFWSVCEDATRMYTDEEWTRYRGVEQGDWKFSIDGRSGGWMVLEDWPGRTPNASHSCPMSWEDQDHYLDWLEQRNDAELEAFYKAIVQLDQDLSPENCRKEIEYQYANRRHGGKVSSSPKKKRQRASSKHPARTCTHRRTEMVAPSKTGKKAANAAEKARKPQRLNSRDQKLAAGHRKLLEKNARKAKNRAARRAPVAPVQDVTAC